MDEYISVDDAATELDINRVTMWKWIKRYELQTVRFIGDRRTMLKRSDLQRFREPIMLEPAVKKLAAWLAHAARGKPHRRRFRAPGSRRMLSPAYPQRIAMATSTKTKKRNWRAWLTDAGYDVDGIGDAITPQLTRAAVLDRAHDLGAPMTDRMLRQWEAAGALPRPERRWSDADNAVVTAYPAFMPHLVTIANALHRGERIPIPDLAPHVEAKIGEAIRRHRLGTRAPDVDDPALAAALLRFVRRLEEDELINYAVDEVALTLRWSGNTVGTFSVPLPVPDDNPNYQLPI